MFILMNIKGIKNYLKSKQNSTISPVIHTVYTAGGCVQVLLTSSPLQCELPALVSQMNSEFNLNTPIPLSNVIFGTC